MNFTELLDILFRLSIAGIIGAAVGVERELHGRWAGLRTHMVVSIAAAIFIITGMGIADSSASDVSRVVQGIAAGIGFLGAGVILKISDKLEVKGLTTAASIWLAAALGTSVGLEMYEVATAGTIVSLIALALLRPLDKLFTHKD